MVRQRGNTSHGFTSVAGEPPPAAIPELWRYESGNRSVVLQIGGGYVLGQIVVEEMISALPKSRTAE